jgi:hypothetical protein
LKLEDKVPWKGTESLLVVSPKKGEDAYQYAERSKEVIREKLETLSEVFASGKAKTPTQIARLAKKLGVTVLQVQFWKSNPSMAERVAEKLKIRAVHMTAEILDKQAVLAESQTAAAKFVAQIAGMGPSASGGIAVQVNTAIDSRGKESESDMAFVERFREAKKNGLFRRLEVSPDG